MREAQVSGQLAKLQRDEEEAIKLLSDPASLPKSPQAAYYAIKYLEGIRSIKAISVLCERLLYEQKVEAFISPVGDADTFPASAALVKIGHPSVEGLLRVIGTTNTSQKYRDVAVGVLAEILGKDGVRDAVERFRKTATEYKKRAGSPQHALYKNYDDAKLLAFRVELV